MLSKWKVAVLTIGLLLSATAVRADEVTKLKFTLDWKLQGIHAWFYWAQEKGYFAAEKLDVTIDQGAGSATTITRVMSGAYDAGFGDANAVIQNAATKPDEAPMIVYMMYSRAPFALVTKASSGINSFKDLAGRKVAGPSGGSTLKLLPLMADGGRIVNVSTGLARFALPGYGAYALAKGAVEVMTRYMALELGPRRIAANTIAPGAIETDFSGGVVRDNPEMNEMVASDTALGRAGLPEDVGGVVASLLSPEMGWVNAQRIEASGGQHL